MRKDKFSVLPELIVKINGVHHFLTMKILLVEDDPSIGELLSTILVDHRYTVDLAIDGSTGLEMGLLWNYDLFVLDVQIPNLDGISLCRQLRLSGNTAPILLLTVQNSTADITSGLDAGADDYVTKPFDPLQLLARIRALLRRSNQAIPASILEWEDLQLNPALMKVTYRQQEVALGVKEYGLLELLLRNPQRIFSRSAILDHLWTIDDFPSEGAVTNLVKDLRRKLKTAGLTAELVETLYGLGYRLKADPKTEETSTEAVLPQPAGQKQRLDSAGRVITQRFKASLSQRIRILADAVQILQTGQISKLQQQQAREEAHRLAGGLGTFGYEQGSVLAEQIEALLNEVALTSDQVTVLSQLLTELTQELSEPLQTQSQPESQPEIQAENQTILQDEMPLSGQSDQQAQVAPCAKPTLLVINADPDFTQAMQTEVHRWDWLVYSIPDWSALQSQNFPAVPNAILLCLDTLATRDGELLKVRTLKTRFPKASLLTYAEQDSLEIRMAAVRLGSCCHLAKPVCPTEVLEAVSQFLLQESTASTQIMVVDEDVTTLTSLTDLLKPWGFEVTSLTDPRQFWSRFTQTRPDLLLLALELPDISGIELCQIIRRDAQSRNLPVLIMTTQIDAPLVNQMLAAGADDCISKSTLESDLPTRIISRLERAQCQHQPVRNYRIRPYSSPIQLDPLTQLADSAAFEQWLTQNWERFCQDQTPVALLLAQVDNFQHYQAQHGAVAGERCLRQIAKTIQSSLQPRDLAARHQDTVFAIVLPQTDVGGALQVAKRLQQAVYHLHVLDQDATASKNVTISLGIAGTVPRGDLPVQRLITAATQALETTQKQGFNTYCLYSL
jgi:diguanylate cyclase (GGDEF)-like protein